MNHFKFIVLFAALIAPPAFAQGVGVPGGPPNVGSHSAGPTGQLGHAVLPPNAVGPNGIPPGQVGRVLPPNAVGPNGLPPSQAGLPSNTVGPHVAGALPSVALAPLGPRGLPASAGGPFGVRPPGSGNASGSAHSLADPSGPIERAVLPDPPVPLLKETAAQTIARAIQRDVVGRPRDSREISRRLVRNNLGEMIVRNQILAVSPSQTSLAIARRLDFTIARRDMLGALRIASITLTPPAGMSEVQALAQLRQADPSGSYDYAHIYDPTGDMIEVYRGPANAQISAPVRAPVPGVRIGMIDGGVGRGHSALRNASMVVRSFAANGETPATVHGTAVASLLVGRDGNFSGFLPSATLYSADVFGGAADGGNAAGIARALNWLAANHIAVANISLAGPPNALLAAAVKAYIDSGHIVVAAVGNDGPAAPPNFPAAYPGVVAVTSVDAERRLQIDANRGQAAFAALGVDVRAASLPQGYINVTGTSFAVPVVSARLGTLLKAPNPDASLKAVTELKQSAVLLKEADQNLSYVLPPMAAAPRAATLATR